MTLRELSPPPGAYDAGSEEVLRVWFAGGSLCTVTGRIDDPVHAGIMLADLSRHASRIFADFESHSPEAELARIMATFDAVQEEHGIERIGDIGLAVVSKPGMPFAELPVPPRAKADPDGGEVIRLWRAGSGIHAVLVGIWDQADNWGLLLSDLSLQLAHTLAAGDLGRAETLRTAIHAALRREWRAPTDPGTTKPHATH